MKKPKGKETKTLYLAIKQPDDDDVGGVVYEFEMGANVTDPEAALRSAVMDYLQTEDGKSVREHNGGCFNWGDAVHIPDIFFGKHGLTPVCKSTSIDVFVDHDEDMAVGME